MPELPEVETALNGVSPYLKGFTIEKIVVRQAKLRWPVSPELLQLSGQKVTALSRRAKYLIIHTPQGYIIGHLGMSGSVRIVPHASPVEKHDHLDIVMNNGKLLRYNDPRRFGAWLWTDNLTDFHLFLKLGPEPLSDAFNADYLFKKSRKKQTALKTIFNGQRRGGGRRQYLRQRKFVLMRTASAENGKNADQSAVRTPRSHH